MLLNGRCFAIELSDDLNKMYHGIIEKLYIYRCLPQLIVLNVQQYLINAYLVKMIHVQTLNLHQV